jgi:hypothetical protein
MDHAEQLVEPRDTYTALAKGQTRRMAELLQRVPEETWQADRLATANLATPHLQALDARARGWSDSVLLEAYRHGMSLADKALPSGARNRVHRHNEAGGIDVYKMPSHAAALGNVQQQFLIRHTRALDVVQQRLRTAPLSKVQQQLQRGRLIALVDKGGNQWSYDTYNDTLANVAVRDAVTAGMYERTLEAGYDLVTISKHIGSCQYCAPWQGRTVSLTGATPGYPTLAEARNTGYGHPHCKHVESPTILPSPPEERIGRRRGRPRQTVWVALKTKVLRKFVYEPIGAWVHWAADEGLHASVVGLERYLGASLDAYLKTDGVGDMLVDSLGAAVEERVLDSVFKKAEDIARDQGKKWLGEVLAGALRSRRPISAGAHWNLLLSGPEARIMKWVTEPGSRYYRDIRRGHLRVRRTRLAPSEVYSIWDTSPLGRPPTFDPAAWIERKVTEFGLPRKEAELTLERIAAGAGTAEDRSWAAAQLRAYLGRDDLLLGEREAARRALVHFEGGGTAVAAPPTEAYGMLRDVLRKQGVFRKTTISNLEDLYQRLQRGEWTASEASWARRALDDIVDKAPPWVGTVWRYAFGFDELEMLTRAALTGTPLLLPAVTAGTSVPMNVLAWRAPRAYEATRAALHVLGYDTAVTADNFVDPAKVLDLARRHVVAFHDISVQAQRALFHLRTEVWTPEVSAEIQRALGRALKGLPEPVRRMYHFVFGWDEIEPLARAYVGGMPPSRAVLESAKAVIWNLLGVEPDKPFDVVAAAARWKVGVKNAEELWREVAAVKKAWEASAGTRAAAPPVPKILLKILSKSGKKVAEAAADPEMWEVLLKKETPYILQYLRKAPTLDEFRAVLQEVATEDLAKLRAKNDLRLWAYLGAGRRFPAAGDILREAATGRVGTVVGHAAETVLLDLEGVETPVSLRDAARQWVHLGQPGIMTQPWEAIGSRLLPGGGQGVLDQGWRVMPSVPLTARVALGREHTVLQTHLGGQAYVDAAIQLAAAHGRRRQYFPLRFEDVGGVRVLATDRPQEMRNPPNCWWARIVPENVPGVEWVDFRLVDRSEVASTPALRVLLPKPPREVAKVTPRAPATQVLEYEPTMHPELDGLLEIQVRAVAGTPASTVQNVVAGALQELNFSHLVAQTPQTVTEAKTQAWLGVRHPQAYNAVMYGAPHIPSDADMVGAFGNLVKKVYHQHTQRDLTYTVSERVIGDVLRRQAVRTAHFDVLRRDPVVRRYILQPLQDALYRLTRPDVPLTAPIERPTIRTVLRTQRIKNAEGETRVVATVPQQIEMPTTVTVGAPSPRVQRALQQYLEDVRREGGLQIAQPTRTLFATVRGSRFTPLPGHDAPINVAAYDEPHRPLMSFVRQARWRPAEEAAFEAVAEPEKVWRIGQTDATGQTTYTYFDAQTGRIIPEEEVTRYQIEVSRPGALEFQGDPVWDYEWTLQQLQQLPRNAWERRAFSDIFRAVLNDAVADGEPEMSRRLLSGLVGAYQQQFSTLEEVVAALPQEEVEKLKQSLDAMVWVEVTPVGGVWTDPTMQSELPAPVGGVWLDTDVEGLVEVVSGRPVAPNTPLGVDTGTQKPPKSVRLLWEREVLSRTDIQGLPFGLPEALRALQWGETDLGGVVFREGLDAQRISQIVTADEPTRQRVLHALEQAAVTAIRGREVEDTVVPVAGTTPLEGLAQLAQDLLLSGPQVPISDEVAGAAVQQVLVPTDALGEAAVQLPLTSLFATLGAIDSPGDSVTVAGMLKDLWMQLWEAQTGQPCVLPAQVEVEAVAQQLQEAGIRDPGVLVQAAFQAYWTAVHGKVPVAVARVAAEVLSEVVQRRTAALQSLQRPLDPAVRQQIAKLLTDAGFVEMSPVHQQEMLHAVLNWELCRALQAAPLRTGPQSTALNLMLRGNGSPGALEQVLQTVARNGTPSPLPAWVPARTVEALTHFFRQQLFGG